MPDEPHQVHLDAALALEAEAQRALLSGEPSAAGFVAAAIEYRASWESAPPASYGRIVGMLKAAVLGGTPDGAAAFALSEVPADAASPVAAYARAVASLIVGDPKGAQTAATTMRPAGGAFERTAVAIAAIATGDDKAFTAAHAAIVADFEARPAHLTGVPIADTAIMLERLAARR